MKVLFYSPYIPKHVGGGEKHIFDIAVTVAQKHEVFIATPPAYFSRENKDLNVKNIREKYESFLNYSLENISFIPSHLFSGSFITRLLETKKFDYIYYVSDGSFFYSLAPKNNLHIQIPFTHSLSLVDTLKLKSWQIINTNSNFTKSIIEKYWKVQVSQVHYPLVSLKEIKPRLQKEKIILHVGRFFKQLHSKRQDVLVEFFKQLTDSNPELVKGWKLVLVGSVEDEEYFDQVKKLAHGYKIDIKTNVTRYELVELYKKAAIYWHATGYGINEIQNPEKVEHFGITTIEAMAAGCVPVVINKGGQKEILGSQLSTLLWDSQEECLKITKKLMTQSEYFNNNQEKTLERVQKFSETEFEKIVWKMF